MLDIVLRFDFAETLQSSFCAVVQENDCVCCDYSELYLETSQTSATELFCKGS